jgi:spore maturation protein CgeB
VKAAYIGIVSPGSTSKMRAETLRNLTPGAEWKWIDTDAPFQKSSRLWRSAAYRMKRGPAVKRINDSVREAIAGKKFDLVWLDKAVFLSENTMKEVRSAARRMAHFTPDAAFHANRSAAFEKSMPLYDLLVTTKSFEVDEYRARVSADAVMLTTQGYDPEVHFPRNEFGQRRREVAFAGLAEPDRERCIAAMLEAGVQVRLGGIGWKGFLRKWSDHPALHFEGEEVFGEAYATLFSRAWIGLGLLTKRFSELHTTRTLEIPACGAVLATERTRDTSTMFSDDEALFFDDYEELASRVSKLFGNDDTTSLAKIAAAGSQRVTRDRRDYPGILAAILANPRLELSNK